MHSSISAAFSVMVLIQYQYAKMQLIYGYSDNQSNYWYNTKYLNFEPHLNFVKLHHV